MDLISALIYGLIQGVSEFLPVSSSGHLAVLPHLGNFEDPGVVFDLLMHLGTAIAVLLYFNKDVIILIKQFKSLVLDRNTKDTAFVQNFLSATFFSFILIMCIKDIAKLAREPIYIGINLIVFGIIMYLSDLLKPKGLDLSKVKGLKQAILIGLAQSIAVFPGVSRSGITLTASRGLGMTREEAGKFSFLLSIPVIIGGIVFKLPDVIKGEATSAGPLVIIVGIFSSFIFGLLTIHYFLKLISKLGLGIFSLYRIIFGIVLLVFF